MSEQTISAVALEIIVAEFFALGLQFIKTLSQ